MNLIHTLWVRSFDVGESCYGVEMQKGESLKWEIEALEEWEENGRRFVTVENKLAKCG